MNGQEQKAVLTISVMAAFADGRKDEQERAQIKRIFDSLAPGDAIDMPSVYQDVLLQRISLEQAAALINSPEARQLAYEMAVCVCDADGVASEAENAFLDRLRTVLPLDAGPARAFARQAEEIAGTAFPAGPASAPAAPAAVDTAELDKMVLNYSLLNGALELLPQSLASMAILPLQTKMVYRVGKAYGYELDAGHIKEFAATLGVGLAGQYVEQMGRKLISGMLKKVAGPLGMLGGAATGSAFSFATTYALGQVAKQYYSSGRTIDTARLKQMFASMIDQGRSLQTRYSGEIQQKARNIDLSQIASLVRQQ